MESQRAEAKQLDEAHLWDMEGDDNEDASFVKSSGSLHDHHKSGRKHLELMMSEAPELRPLLSRLKCSLSQLTGTIDPLCRYSIYIYTLDEINQELTRHVLILINVFSHSPTFVYVHTSSVLPMH